jgi:hypothetical protein
MFLPSLRASSIACLSGLFLLLLPTLNAYQVLVSDQDAVSDPLSLVLQVSKLINPTLSISGQTSM